jgi:hypothetical protein
MRCHGLCPFVEELVGASEWRVTSFEFRGGRKTSGESRCIHSQLATRCSLLATLKLNICINGMRGICLKTTGQIQKDEDFFRPGIAEVPTEKCSILRR